MEPLTTHLVLAPSASIDLQLHTTYSDGEWTPEQLIDYLVGEQFGLVAITDHDRVDTVTSLQHLARQKQLPLLVAAEMSTSWKGEATDVLCYGFDPQGNELHDLAQDVLRRQREITQEVYGNLLRKGYAFPHQLEVLNESGGEPRQVNDFVALIEQHGYGTEEEAFKIVFDAGFFFATNDIAKVVDAGHCSGGVCLIAHPGRGGGNLTRYDVSLLDQLRQEVPIDGFEVYYPAHTPEQIAMYLGVCSEALLTNQFRLRLTWPRQETNQIPSRTEPTPLRACWHSSRKWNMFTSRHISAHVHLDTLLKKSIQSARKEISQIPRTQASLVTEPVVSRLSADLAH